MSYSKYLYTFSLEQADEAWSKLDETLVVNLDIFKKIENLEISDLSPYDVDDDLLYNPKRKKEYLEHVKKIKEQNKNKSKYIDQYQKEYPAVNSNIIKCLSYNEILNSDEVESDFINFDLALGGQEVSFHSFEDPISEIEFILLLLFNKDFDSLKKEDLLIIFEKHNSLEILLDENKDKLIEYSQLFKDTYNSDFNFYKKEMIEYIFRLKRLVDDFTDKKDSLLINLHDNDDFIPEISLLLRERSRVHIEKYKQNSTIGELY